MKPQVKFITFKVIILLFAIITIIIGFNLNPTKIVNVNASYNLYTNLDAIINNADTIIVGKVINVGKGFVVDRNNYIVGERSKEIISTCGKHLYAYTPYKVEALQVLKGDLTPNDMIRINQEGGTYENTYYKIDGNKLYEHNQLFVFFLRKGDISTEQAKKDFKEEFYLPLNPFQGQLSIENSNVHFSKDFNFMQIDENFNDISVNNSGNYSMNLDKFIELVMSHL